jgi:hypothetical protein
VAIGYDRTNRAGGFASSVKTPTTGALRGDEDQAASYSDVLEERSCCMNC